MHQRAPLVEGIAISPYLINMGMELRSGGVGFIFQIILDSLKIHRLFNDIEIVQDSISLWVNRDQEGVGTSVLLQLGQNEIALSKIVLHQYFTQDRFPSLCRLFFQKFINFFNAGSLVSALNLFRILDISRQHGQMLGLFERVSTQSWGNLAADVMTTPFFICLCSIRAQRLGRKCWMTIYCQQESEKSTGCIFQKLEASMIGCSSDYILDLELIKQYFITKSFLQNRRI